MTVRASAHAWRAILRSRLSGEQRVGLAVVKGVVSGAHARDGRIVSPFARAELPPAGPDATEGTRTAVAAVLAALVIPARTRQRTVVLVALDAPMMQLRALEGLPAGADDETIARAVRENARFWFLDGMPGGVLSEVGSASDGSRWGTALDPVLATTITAACRDAGFALCAFIHAALVMDAVLGTTDVRYPPERARFEIRFGASGEIGTARRVRGDEERSAADHAEQVVLPEGCADAADLAAGGAARLDRRVWAHRLVHGVDRMRGGRAAGSPVLTRAVVALYILAALAYPVVALGSGAMHARALERLAAGERTAAATHQRLAATSDTLIAVAARLQATPSTLSLLHQLAAALPEGVAITTVRLDTARGLVVVQGPRAGETADRLERRPGIIAPRLVGPVTSETVGGRTVDRATVEFQRPPEGR